MFSLPALCRLMLQFGTIVVIAMAALGCGSSGPGDAGNGYSTLFIGPSLDRAILPTITSNSTTLVLSGSCVPRTPVRLGGTVLPEDVMSPAASLTSDCPAGLFAFTIRKSDDGLYNFWITQNLNGVDIGADRVITWMRDTSAPQSTAVTSPSLRPLAIAVPSTTGVTKAYYSSTLQTILPIEGICERGGTVTITGSESASGVCVSGTFSFIVMKAPGSLNNFEFAVTQADPAGNVSPPARFRWIRQNPPSAPMISTPLSSPVVNNLSSLRIAGACQDGNVVYLAGAANDSIECSGSSFEFIALLTGSENLALPSNFSVTQKNQAGALSAASPLQWIHGADL